MTTHKVFKDVTKEEKRKYVLCYIDSVPRTYTDLDPRSKVLSETTEYKEYAAKKKAYFDEILKRDHSYSSSQVTEYDRTYDPWDKFKLDYCDYPHPDYIAGNTHYFYFTDNMSEQWGDDWNDAPYEHNAGGPYDGETNIICIPVKLTYSYLQNLACDEENPESYKLFKKEIKKYPGYNNCDMKFPSDDQWNSPYSIDLINHGAVAWLFFAKYDYSIKDSVAIYGGDSIKDVKKKLKTIDKILKHKIEKK